MEQLKDIRFERTKQGVDFFNELLKNDEYVNNMKELNLDDNAWKQNQ